jgi:hypothetical protein
MTDVEGSGPIPRRSPRPGDGGSQVSGALAIVLAVVAVVAGFLILRSISGDGDQQLGIPQTGTGASDGGGDVTPATTLPPGGTTLPTTPPVTTAPPLVFTGASVMVVNANGQGGTAGQMSRALLTAGFDTVDPTDAAGLPEPLQASIVYYDPAQTAALDVASSVNRVLGGDLSVLPLPAGTPPVAGGSLNGAGVVLMLGTDKAGRTLDELNPAGAQTPAVVTNPPLDAGTTAPAG